MGCPRHWGDSSEQNEVLSLRGLEFYCREAKNEQIYG